VKLGIAVFLVLIVVAGGIAAIVAVLVLFFDLAWEHHRLGSLARESIAPGDGTTPGAGHGPGHAGRPPGQEEEQQ
jgi:hypothetical protein